MVIVRFLVHLFPKESQKKVGILQIVVRWFFFQINCGVSYYRWIFLTSRRPVRPPGPFVLFCRQGYLPRSHRTELNNSVENKASPSTGDALKQSQLTFTNHKRAVIKLRCSHKLPILLYLDCYFPPLQLDKTNTQKKARSLWNSTETSPSHVKWSMVFVYKIFERKTW